MELQLYLYESELWSNDSQFDKLLLIYLRFGFRAGKSCLSVVDRSKEAAAVLLAEFLIRPDMKLVYLESELRKSIDLLKTLSTASNDETLRAWGLLLLISQIFKKGTREDLLEHSDLVLDGLCHCQFEKSSNSLLRKMMTKCIQRIGMVMLKPKIATWRYQRGSRSLMAKMGKNPEFNSVVNKLEEDDSEDYDIPEQIELIIGCLLRNLKV